MGPKIPSNSRSRGSSGPLFAPDFESGDGPPDLKFLHPRPCFRNSAMGQASQGRARAASVRRAQSRFDPHVLEIELRTRANGSHCRRTRCASRQCVPGAGTSQGSCTKATTWPARWKRSSRPRTSVSPATPPRAGSRCTAGPGPACWPGNLSSPGRPVADASVRRSLPGRWRTLHAKRTIAPDATVF